MRPTCVRLAAQAVLCLTVSALSAQDMQVAVDWSSFLARSDMLWTQMPTRWEEGAFIGNGIVGAIFWQQDNGLFFEISRTDGYDHRNGTAIATSRYRMPNGNFMLTYHGHNPSGQMRLDLWNAEARGQITTDAGSIRIRALTHAIDEVIYLEVTTAGDEELDFTWHPDILETPRDRAKGLPGTTAYLPQTMQTVGDVHIGVQAMPDDEKYNTQGRGVGEVATAWKVVEVANGQYRIYISEVYTYPGATATQQAVANVNQAASRDVKDFITTHRNWWHAFYPKSFLSFSDANLESFYWIQMYKLASATREDRPILDLAGPWFKRQTRWPGIWWNLNVQSAYGPCYASNHNDLANSLTNAMVNNKANLEANAGGNGRYAIGRATGVTLEEPARTSGGEVGNLGYALHNIWLQYRMTMDESLLRDALYPLLRGSYLFYMDHYVEKGDDGRYHLKPSYSPEYTNNDYPPPPDANFNLAVLSWMLRTMIYANDRLNLNDPIIQQVRDVQANLADYPTYPGEGFTIGRDQRYAYSHRHWAHLFMIYPLYEYTYDNPQQSKLIDQSLAHWLSLSEAFSGFSWPVVASMKAMKGDGNAALDYLLRMFDHNLTFALPNTMCLERWPVIETPLMAASAIQDMVLSSYGNVIRVFPAVPDAWPDVVFHDMRAEGAFLVSARRSGGKTQWVRIESLAGEPCVVQTDLAGTIKTQGDRAFELTDLGGGRARIDLQQGEWVILYSGQQPAMLRVEPVDVVGPTNPWGTFTSQQKQVSF